MITLEDVLNLHQASIDDYGGAHGIRDNGLLESALARPFQTFGGNELYLLPIEKSAAVGQSLIINHPFVDGNKRTGLLVLLSLLLEYDIEVSVPGNELYNFVIRISTGELNFDEIVLWLNNNSNQK